MTEMNVSIAEPFTSPAWGSNFAVFSGGELVAEDSSKELMRRACKYARHHKVYLVPQMFMLMGYRCMCLISPDGKVLGAQKALYRNTTSRIGKHSSELEIINTEFGGILLCVDVDVYRPEVSRIATGMGAQYMISSQSITNEDYNSSMVLTGVWNAAQTSNIYTIATSNQFSCICAPYLATRHGDGFICTPSVKTPMTAALDIADLKKAKSPFRLSRQFYATHRSDLIR